MTERLSDERISRFISVLRRGFAPADDDLEEIAAALEGLLSLRAAGPVIPEKLSNEAMAAFEDAIFEWGTRPDADAEAVFVALRNILLKEQAR